MDATSILDLEGGVSITGGLIASGDIVNRGTIESERDSSLPNPNNVLQNVAIVNHNLLHVVDGQLTLSQGTTVTNDAVNGELRIADGATLLLNQATLHGGSINDGTLGGSGGVAGLGDSNAADFGLIDVAGNSAIDSNASLNNGKLTLESSKTLILDDVTVTGSEITNAATSSTIQVDDGNTLTLNKVTIHGGTITDGDRAGTGTVAGLGTIDATLFGFIDVTGNSAIDSNAQINKGKVTVESGKTLILDDVTVSGSEITNSGASVQIDNGQTLTLTQATLHGGTINDGTLGGSGGVAGLGTTNATLFGLIDVTGNSAIDSNAQINKGKVTVESGKTLILDDVTVSGSEITNSGASVQIDNGQTLTLTQATLHGGTINDGTLGGSGGVAGLGTTNATLFGLIDVTGNSAIDSNAQINKGKVTVESGKTLILDDVTVSGSEITNSGASVQIDNGQTLTLTQATLHGGTINDGTLGGSGGVAGLGTTNATLFGLIDVTGNSAIDSNAQINKGKVTVESGKTLILDDVTVSGSEITNSGASVQIDNGQTLTLTQATLHGGTINDGTLGGSGGVAGLGTTNATLFGLIDVTGNSAIDSNAQINKGKVTVESGKTLILDDVTVSGSEITNSGASVQIDNGQTLTLTQATLHGGTINDGTLGGSGGVAGLGTTNATLFGLIDVTGNSAIDSNAQINKGKVTVESGKTLILDDVTVSGSEITNSGASVQIDNGQTLTLTQATLHGGTINDGTLGGSGGVAGLGTTNATLFGLIDVTGNSAIDSNAQINKGKVTVESGKTLILDDVTITGSDITNATTASTLQVDNDDTLTLSGVTIRGGTITDGTAFGTGTVAGITAANFGLIDVTGNSAIEGAASAHALLNNGKVTVEAGKTLILDDVTITGSDITNATTASTLQVDNDDTLTLSGVTIRGGTINNGTEFGDGSVLGLNDSNSADFGFIDVTRNSAIEGTSTTHALLNNGKLMVENGVTLILDDVTVSGSEITSIDPIGSVIQIDNGHQLTLTQATIHGGTVNDNGGQLLITTSIGLTLVTLDGVIVDDDTTSPIPPGVPGIDVAAGVLTLTGGTQILGGSTGTLPGDAGTLTIESNGELQVTGSGAALDGMQVADNNAGGTNPGIDVLGATLTLEDGTVIGAAISRGTLTVDSTGELLIIAGQGADGAAVSMRGATLDAIAVTDNNTTATGIDVASGAVLKLNDGATISGNTTSNGTMTLAGTVEVDSGTTNEISYITVTDDIGGSSEIHVKGGTLTLEHASFSGGEITIIVDPGATLNVDDSFIDNANIIINSGGTINTANSTIQTVQSGLSGHNTVQSGTTLTLVDETVTGTIDDQGRILVETNGAFGAIFDGVVVDDDTVSPHSGIEIATGATLTLEDNAQIQGGGTGTLTIQNGAQLAIIVPVGGTPGTGATLDGVQVTDSNDGSGTIKPGIDVGSTAVLTLNDGTTISGGTMTVESAGKLLVAAGSGVESPADDTSDTVDDSSISGRGATLEGMTVTNTGTLEVLAAGTLTLNSDLLTNTSGIITVDSTGTLDLTGGDTINGGQLNNAGQINVSGSGNAIENENTGTNIVTNSGTLEVLAAGTLTLLDDTVNNFTTPATTPGIITVDSTGTLDLTGGDTINNGQLNNAGLIKVTGTGNTIENETGGATIGTGTNSFTNTGTLEVAGTLTLNSDLLTNTSSIITVDSTGTLALTGGDTLNDGQLNNAGHINVSGSGNAIENETGGTTIGTGTNSFTNTGTLEVLAAGTLTLNSDLLTNTSGIITVDSTGTLDLTGGDTINGGQLNNAGQINVSGSGNAIENENTGTNIVTNSGTLEVLAAGTLTLLDDTVNNFTTPATTPGIITVDSTGTLDLTGGDTINNGQLNNAGLIKVTGTGNTIENETGGATIGTGTNSFTNTGTLEVAGTLTLNSDLLTNTSSIITVDSTGTLALTGGDTLNDGQLNNAGHINVSGSGNEIENETGGTTIGTGTNSFTNTGTLEVLAAGTLTLNSDLLTNTSGSIQVDAAAELDLTGGTTIYGGGAGQLTNLGTLKVIGTSGADATLDNLAVTNGSGAIITLDNGSTLVLDHHATITGGELHFDAGSELHIEDANGAGQEVFLHNVNLTGGAAGHIVIDTDPATLVLDQGTTVNGGSILVDTAGTLKVEHSGVSSTDATLSGVSVTDSNLIQVDGTLALGQDSGGHGTSISGAGSLTVAGTINATSGSNSVSVATLNISGTLQTTGGTLAIAASTSLSNSGTLAAINGQTLEIDSNLSNSGLLEATAGSSIDFKGSTITWTGSTPTAGQNGIWLDGSGATLLVDSASTLTLTGANGSGSGAVSLVGGTIRAPSTITGSRTLENFNNTISGYGTIGNAGDGKLMLQNDAGGFIDASVAAQALVIATGHVITNAGHLQATGGGTLDIKDSEIANAILSAKGSITVDGTSTFKVDNADLQLTGQGSMTLTSGSKVIGNGSTATLLENFDNTITGAGTIGSGAAGMLSLKNDLGGTINANVNDPAKMLTLHTGAAVINLGLLEATSGGTLDVQDAEITNRGTAASNTGIAINAATLLVDVSSLTLDGGGDVALSGGTITGAAMAPSQLDELINQDNIFGTGTISNLDLYNSGTINANDTSGGTLRLATGMQIENLAGGTLEATGGGKLEIDDNLSNSGLLKADTLGGTAAPAIDFRGSSISWDGGAPSAPGANGIQLTGSTGTGAFFVVDPSSGGKLTLTGTAAQSGVVSLSGGTIKAPNFVYGTMTPFTGTYTLENVNNTIEGNGSIAVNMSGSGTLILQNDAAGTINATGVLTLNTGNSITNSGLLKATAGGTLDVRDTSINNQGSGLQGLGISLASGTLLEVDIAPGTGGTLTLTGGGTVVIAGGTIKGNDHNSEKLNNSNNFISGSGTIGGTNFSLINDGTIQALGGTLDIKPNITRSSPTVLSGNLQIGDGATLNLDGSTPETINFLTDTNSNQGTLYLNDTTGGTGASNTVNTTTLPPSTSGTFEITGPGDVTATSGSGIRFVTTTTGTANITIDGRGNVSGGSGFVGITAQLNNALDSGSITIHQFGNVSGGQEGIVAITQGNGNVSVTTVDNVTVTTNNSSTANKDFSAIFAATSGTGSLSVTTASGHTINSTNGGAANGGAGIQALNEDSNATDNTGGITVNAYGTINSGSTNNANGTEPAGIIASYTSAASGSVEVDDNATNINAGAGPGILANMSTGAGDVTVNLGPGVQITAQNSASPTSTTNQNKAPFGIQAGSTGTGSVYVNMATSADDVIMSGSAGIAAFNDFDPTSSTTNSSNPGTIDVVAYGTINSGTILTNTGKRPAGIIATYQGGTGSSANQPNPFLFGSITVDSHATITAQAGDGIRAVNYGIGSVSVTDEASTTITASVQYGIEAASYEHGDITLQTLGADDKITAGGDGLRAVNLANDTGGVSSTIHVTAKGMINSGSTSDTDFTTVSPAGILAGFFGATPSPPLPSNATLIANANVLGNVIVDNYANVTASAGDGIEALNYGKGNITIHNYSGTTVSGPIGLYALTAESTDANSNTATITITNDGAIKGAGTSQNPVIEITQSGGSATINNTKTNTSTGIIEDSSAQPSASSIAISETGGSLTVNNDGTIIGVVNADLAFYNNAGATWDVAGTNTFTGAINTISNAGTINIEGTSSFATTGSNTLAITDTGTINLQTGNSLTLGGVLNVSGGGTVTLASGTGLTDTFGITFGTSGMPDNGFLTGTGTVTASLALAASSNSLGSTITAEGGGTLDLQGTIGSGLVLAIDSTQANTLKIDNSGDTIAAVSITSGNQTLEIAKSTTITGVQNVTLGTILLDSGATLTDTSGITFGTSGSNGFLTGIGTVAANLSRAIGSTGQGSTITAKGGGTLDLQGTIGSGLVLAIDSTQANTLQIDSTTSISPLVLNNSNQTLTIGASPATVTISGQQFVTGGAKIIMKGGTLADTSGITLGNASSVGKLFGGGTVTAALNAGGAGEGFVTARITSGNPGTLDLQGVLDPNLVLAIDATTGNQTTLRIDSNSMISALMLNNANQILAIGGNVTINGAQTVGGNAQIQMKGGTLNDSSGIVLGSGGTAGTLLGKGTITANLTAGSGGGTVTARSTNGAGVLDLQGTIDSTLALAIDVSTNNATALKIEERRSARSRSATPCRRWRSPRARPSTPRRTSRLGRC